MASNPYDYCYGFNGFDASGGYSEQGASGNYGGFDPNAGYGNMGGGAPPAGSTGAGIPQEDPNRLQLKSDEKHGQILKKHMGSSARKMFVGGLAHETTTANLWEYFEQFGEMEDVDIKCDVYTGASRGFGFILFKEAASVDKVKAQDAHNLDGKRIDPKGASKNSKIFVGGLKPETDDETIKTFFTELYGEIASFERGVDKHTEMPRPFAFLTLKDEDMAAKCVKEKWHTIDDKQVECKSAVDNYQYKQQRNFNYQNNYRYDSYGGPSFGSSYGQFGGGGPSRQNKGMNRSNPY